MFYAKALVIAEPISKPPLTIPIGCGAIPHTSIMNKKKAEYTRLAKKLIRTLPEFEGLRDADLRFVCVASDVEKRQNGKTVFADCMKVNKARYDWCCPYDFIITVYEPNVVDLTWEQISILLQHEIRHMGVNNEGNEPSFFVVPHDIEEFWGIIDKYGMHWQEKRETE